MQGLSLFRVLQSKKANKAYALNQRPRTILGKAEVPSAFGRMVGTLALVLFVSTHLLKGCHGLQWLQELSDGAELTRCIGEDATFPWRFALTPGSQLVGVSWTRHHPEDGDTNLATFAFKKFTSTVDRISQVGEAGIRLSDLRTDDTASYTVSVRLSDAIATQTVELQVAEMPATASGRLEVMIREKMADTTEGQEETSSGQQLMCGEFTNLGSPPVSVVWEDPEGNLLPSSSFQGGFFILDLPDGYSGGNYYCLLNLSSTAVGCLPDSSALRDKAMVGVLKQAAPSTAGLSSGAVVGVIVAVLILIVVIVVAVVFFLKYKRGKSYAPKEPESPGPDQEAAEPLKA